MTYFKISGTEISFSNFSKKLKKGKEGIFFQSHVLNGNYKNLSDKFEYFLFFGF